MANMFKWIYDGSLTNLLAPQNTTTADIIIDATCKGSISVLDQYAGSGFDFINFSQEGNYLIHVAAYNGQMDVVKWFLDKGENVNKLGKNNNTPLHYACSQNRVNVAEYLILHGGNPHACNSEGKTPYDLAGETRFSLKQMLLKYMYQTPEGQSQQPQAVDTFAGFSKAKEDHETPPPPPPMATSTITSSTISASAYPSLTSAPPVYTTQGNAISVFKHPALANRHAKPASLSFSQFKPIPTNVINHTDDTSMNTHIDPEVTASETLSAEESDTILSEPAPITSTQIKHTTSIKAYIPSQSISSPVSTHSIPDSPKPPVLKSSVSLPVTTPAIINPAPVTSVPVTPAIITPAIITPSSSNSSSTTPSVPTTDTPVKHTFGLASKGPRRQVNYTRYIPNANKSTATNNNNNTTTNTTSYTTSTNENMNQPAIIQPTNSVQNTVSSTSTPVTQYATISPITSSMSTGSMSPVTPSPVPLVAPTFTSNRAALANRPKPKPRNTSRLVSDGFITTVGNPELARKYGNHDATVSDTLPPPPQ